jgi:hypothetical protein
MRIAGTQGGFLLGDGLAHAERKARGEHDHGAGQQNDLAEVTLPAKASVQARLIRQAGQPRGGGS